MTEKLAEHKKRFNVQKDGFLNIYEARRRAVQSAVQELVRKREGSFVIGATLFGSLSKGSSRYASDADVFLFYDTGAAAKNMKVPEIELFRASMLENLVRFQDGKERGMTFDKIPLSSQVAITYLTVGEDTIRKYISKLRMPAKPHVVPVGISERVIDDAVRVLLGEKGIQNPFSALTRIKALFHQAVTQGVFPYRQQVIQRLLRAGPRGQKVWQALIGEVARFEQFNKSAPSKDDDSAPDLSGVRYPWTLPAAARLYAPKLFNKKAPVNERVVR